MHLKTIVLVGALSTAPGLLHAQFDLTLEGRDVRVHSFGSEGFARSNNNNYPTMNSSKGSFAMTDGGGETATDRVKTLEMK